MLVYARLLHVSVRHQPIGSMPLLSDEQITAASSRSAVLSYGGRRHLALSDGGAELQKKILQLCLALLHGQTIDH